MSENGRGAAWHVWINAVWHGKGTAWERHGICELAIRCILVYQHRRASCFKGSAVLMQNSNPKAKLWNPSLRSNYIWCSGGVPLQQFRLSDCQFEYPFGVYQMCWPREVGSVECTLRRPAFGPYGNPDVAVNISVVPSVIKINYVRSSKN
jgi:hypothetical protein